MSPNLSIFAPTADQRYLLGADLFLRTHYPMSLRTYGPQGQLQTISEEKLLQYVLQKNHSVGNRVWVLYGAPGSGKSELIKWLETRIIQEAPVRGQLMVRISRQELDVLSIFNRFLALLPDRFMSETTAERWATARKKSRTLTKLILLFALENLLDSDDLINALFYRLLNVLQPHVERILATEVEGDDSALCLELIGQETWAAIVQESPLTIPIAYEQFRHQLTVAFREHLLEGLSLSSTMARIAQTCQETHGRRPLLLVDDLVQSMNVFATDLLDYILTLEEGNWDVVVGLTPAAFEDNQRGRALLQRIAYLDTIDDRVEKMWLSDETGQESYILTEANCDQFAARYLAEIETTSHDDLPFYPFTREALVRIYRGLPLGKGKVRYFVRHLHSITQRVQDGEDILDVLIDFAQPEYIARVANNRLARLCEFYGPVLQPETATTIHLSPTLLEAFAVAVTAEPVPIEPLVRFFDENETRSYAVEDESQAAVRDWLLGKDVNRQLLKTLRQGVARWLRTVEPLEWFYRDHTSKPLGALRWRQTYLAVRPPICFEGVDEEQEGIMLTRDVGMVAFDLCRYAKSRGSNTKALQQQLALTPALVPLQQAGAAYRRGQWQRLEAQLGMSLSLLALSLQTFYMTVHGADGYRVAALPADYWTWVEARRQRYQWQRERIGERTWQAIQTFYTDFFELRKSLYDGALMRDLAMQYPYSTWFDSLCDIAVEGISDDFVMGSRPLSNVLRQVQEYIQRCEQARHMPLSASAQSVLDKLKYNGGLMMADIDPSIFEEIKMLVPDVYTALQIHLGN